MCVCMVVCVGLVGLLVFAVRAFPVASVVLCTGAPRWFGPWVSVSCVLVSCVLGSCSWCLASWCPVSRFLTFCLGLCVLRLGVLCPGFHIYMECRRSAYTCCAHLGRTLPIPCRDVMSTDNVRGGVWARCTNARGSTCQDPPERRWVAPLPRGLKRGSVSDRICNRPVIDETEVSSTLITMREIGICGVTSPPSTPKQGGS